MNSGGKKWWIWVVVLRPAAAIEVVIHASKTSSFVSPHEETPTGMLEAFSSNVDEEVYLSSTVMQQLEMNMKIPFKKRLIPAAGNAVSRQPTAYRSFRVCLQKAALTKVIHFVMQLISSGWWLHRHKSPMTLAKCWTMLKGWLRARFPHGIGRCNALWLSLCPILLVSHSSRGVK